MEHDKKDGSKGFSPKLGGNGKAGITGTSSFDIGTKEQAVPKDILNGEEQPGQEENGRKRQPTSSAVVRAGKESL